MLLTAHWPDLECWVDRELPGLFHLCLRRRDHKGKSKGNALNESLVTQLTEALSWVREAPDDIKVVLVQSRTPKFFCTGLDVHELKAELDEGGDNKMRFTALVDLFDLITDSQAYFVGAVRGLARGAGATLLLACDQVIADGSPGEHGRPSVTLAHPEKHFEMLPWLSIRHVLRRLVGGQGQAGYDAARRYFSGPEVWDAHTCLLAGLVDHVWLPTDGQMSFDAYLRNTVTAVLARIEQRAMGKNQHAKRLPLPLETSVPADVGVEELLQVSIAYLQEAESPLSRASFKKECVEKLCKMARTEQTRTALARYIDKMKGNGEGR